jgi:hypothetical protein
MNQNDSHQNFKREIKMFDKCINNLLELYSNGGNIVVNKSIENFARSQADKEGGNFEIN